MNIAIVDIALILIVIFFAFVGLKRGFVKSLVNFLGTMVVLVLSFVAAKPVGGMLNNWFGLNNTFANMLQDPLAPYCVSSYNAGLDNPLMNKIAEIFIGPEYWLNYSDGVNSAEFLADFSAGIGKLITMAIAMVVLYIIFKIAIWLLSKLFKFLTKDRVIGGYERLFGFAMGAVEGFVKLWIWMCVAYLLIPALPMFTDTITSLLDTNNMTNEFYTLIGEFMEGIVLPWMS